MNIDRDIILSRFKKLDALIQVLEEIKKKPKDEFISKYVLYLSAQRALETCINICIDIGNHILSLNKNGKPETYSEIFVELSKVNVINNELKDKLNRFDSNVVYKTYNCPVLEANIQGLEFSQLLLVIFSQLLVVIFGLYTSKLAAESFDGITSH